MSNAIGILGVGHLATYVAKGLLRSVAGHDIVLSPRNTERSAALSRESDCTVAADNQGVVEAADILMLSARPAQVIPMVEELRFRPGQLLISVAAGLQIREFEGISGDTTIVRALPLSCAELNESPTLLFPHDERAEGLLSVLGPVHVVDSEEQFTAASAVSAFYGWVYAWLGQAADWTSRAGMPDDLGKALVLQTVLGAVKMCAVERGRSPGSFVASLATPGGITEHGLRLLEERGALEAWQEALDSVWGAIRRGAPAED